MTMNNNIKSKPRQTSHENTGESMDFWKSKSLQELARLQEVQPLADVRVLSGTWPGEKNDGFEEAIEELRKIG